MSNSGWIFISAGSIGLIFGFMLGVIGADLAVADKLKAGFFEHDGIAYKIERIGQ